MRWQDKVAEVRAAMKTASSRTKKVTSLLVTQLDEVAWLFNLRGDDMPNVPGNREDVPDCYMVTDWPYVWWDGALPMLGKVMSIDNSYWKGLESVRKYIRCSGVWIYKL